MLVGSSFSRNAVSSLTWRSECRSKRLPLRYLASRPPKPASGKNPRISLGSIREKLAKQANRGIPTPLGREAISRLSNLSNPLAQCAPGPIAAQGPQREFTRHAPLCGPEFRAPDTQPIDIVVINRPDLDWRFRVDPRISELQEKFSQI